MSPCQHPPVVTIRALEADLDEGDTLHLACHYTASPPTLEAVTFTHNKAEVSLAPVDRGDRLEVVVTNVTGDMAGDWGCQLTNTRGQGSSEVRVRVRRRPSVRISIRSEAGQPGAEVRVTEASAANISLRCELVPDDTGRKKRRRHRHQKAQELTSVQWLMDELPLYRLPLCSADLATDLCDVDPSSLLLESVNRHFHGAYSCVGSLASGLSSLVSNTVLLSVQHPPGPAEVRPGPGQPLPVYRGDKVSLECWVTSPGRPASASLTWRLDGAELSGEDTRAISLDTGQLAGVHKVIMTS